MKVCQTLKLIVDEGMKVSVDWAKLKVEVWDGVAAWYTADLSSDGFTCDKDPYKVLAELVQNAANRQGLKEIK